MYDRYIGEKPITSFDGFAILLLVMAPHSTATASRRRRRRRKGRKRWQHNSPSYISVLLAATFSMAEVNETFPSPTSRTKMSMEDRRE
jgi:hypothetical protein